jgi:hypothetical protein
MNGTEARDEKQGYVTGDVLGPEHYADIEEPRGAGGGEGALQRQGANTEVRQGDDVSTAVSSQDGPLREPAAHGDPTKDR